MATVPDIDGLEALDKELKQLPANIQKKLLRKPLRAGAVLMRNAVQSSAPRNTGATARAVKIEQVRSRSNPSRITYAVGIETGKVQRSSVTSGLSSTRVKGALKVRKASARERRGEDPYYWRFQEFGYHTRAKAGARGRHIPGKHFMRKAFLRTYSSAKNLVSNELAKGLNNYRQQT